MPYVIYCPLGRSFVPCKCTTYSFGLRRKRMTQDRRSRNGRVPPYGFSEETLQTGYVHFSGVILELQSVQGRFDGSIYCDVTFSINRQGGRVRNTDLERQSENQDTRIFTRLLVPNVYLLSLFCQTPFVSFVRYFPFLLQFSFS